MGTSFRAIPFQVTRHRPRTQETRYYFVDRYIRSGWFALAAVSLLPPKAAPIQASITFPQPSSDQVMARRLKFFDRAECAIPKLAILPEAPIPDSTAQSISLN
jgi:hypothetical protein